RLLFGAGAGRVVREPRKILVRGQTPSVLVKSRRGSMQSDARVGGGRSNNSLPNEAVPEADSTLTAGLEQSARHETPHAHLGVERNPDRRRLGFELMKHTLGLLQSKLDAEGGSEARVRRKRGL